MKNNKNRELDNSAKLFPLVICKKYNGTFRISFTLSSNVDQHLLQKATIKTLDELPFYKYKIKKGLFWHYLVENNSSIIIKKTNSEFHNKINLKENNNYLFKITYIDNKVNVDILHYLCDGISGKIFVNRIIENYLLFTKNKNDESKNKFKYTNNDDYLKNYTKLTSKKIYKNESKNVYKIKGTSLKNNIIDITKLNINLKLLEKESKRKDCSITEYICSLLIYSIKNTISYKKKVNKKICICVPIDLRNKFNSTTLNNFFSYMYIESDKSEFDYIIKDVKEQFKINLEKQNLQNRVNELVKLGTNKIIRKIPLFLKGIIVQIIYWKISDNSTMILSNFGKFDFKENIEQFETIIEPDPTKLVKCCFCSYNGEVSLVFSSKIKEKDLEQVFLQEIQRLSYTM